MCSCSCFFLGNPRLLCLSPSPFVAIGVCRHEFTLAPEKSIMFTLSTPPVRFLKNLTPAWPYPCVPGGTFRSLCGYYSSLRGLFSARKYTGSLLASTPPFSKHCPTTIMSRVKDLAWPSQMPEDEWAEVVQGIPAKDEPFLKKYLDGREALIAQEKKRRSGKGGFFSQELF